jgi:hypothetical protein
LSTLSHDRPTRRAGATATEARAAPGGRTLPLAYTFALAAVLFAATGYGLLIEGAYAAPEGVRPTLPETLRGQDLVTMIAAIALVWGGIRARAGSLGGHIVWLAVCLYVPYTYLMYVVAPYNDALLLYIAAIGLGGFGLLNGLLRLDPGATAQAFERAPRRPVAWFLIVVALLFATMWLVDILSVWPGGVPDSLFTYDIPSVVHVLDLGVVLPLLFATGVLLLRGHPIAPVLAAMLLVKTLTLGLALLSMNAFVAASGGRIDAAEPFIWAAVVVVTATWLVIGTRRMRPVEGPWLRPTVW